ncbi:hypothetical protein QYM36_017599 [Artemia franciscana]|uniref:Uncharacterized protein n=1 Tax=Artemia franciscana TaxID=6661 RepID=A0AA88H648_ARTSF|nr:hypothetical protein QYM36_017599 [Artemia franciscana]
MEQIKLSLKPTLLSSHIKYVYENILGIPRNSCKGSLSDGFALNGRCIFTVESLSKVDGLDSITPIGANEQPGSTEASPLRLNDLFSFENETPALSESTVTPESSWIKSEEQKEPAPIFVESSSDNQTPQLVEPGPSKPSSQSSPQKLKTGLSKGTNFLKLYPLVLRISLGAIENYMNN